MNDQPVPRGRRKLWPAACVLGLLALGAAGYFGFMKAPPGPPAAKVEGSPPALEATADQVHGFCGACHAYPPPETFPRSAWRFEVRQGYDFFRNSGLQIDFPSLESVALYYEHRAPQDLPVLPREATSPSPVRFERLGYRPPGQGPFPGVSNVNLVHLFSERQMDVLVCDAHLNQVLAFRPYAQPPSWQVLATVAAPAHAEVVDLDGDGIKDIVVACLGSFFPRNDLVGSVVWLKGSADGTFTPITLWEGVGRVADVQAADFNQDGKLDLVVGVFGWRTTGEILYLENQTSDWSHPAFVPHVLDDRHGAIHVPVGDLNGDGLPDIVGLISQEHETVVAFLNEGKGRFRKETIYTAPHPAFGSSGIQLVDLDGDGDLDVLYTNGDILDAPYLLKPYHGVQWLENQGRFPFVPHPLASLYGAMRAVAGDVDGDGDLDIVAVSYLPGEEFPERDERKLDSVILLEQVGPGRFVRHTLETVSCNHFTCALGDVYGDGRTHLVTGNFGLTDALPINDAVVVWKNLGPDK